MSAAPADDRAEELRPSPPDPEAVSARQYLFLAFLTLLNIMNFVDRQLLASFANFIVPDLGLSNTEFGLLTGFAFIVFYATMGLFMGALADRVHRPRLIAAAITLWSLLTAASGMARGFVTLAIPRALIGIGESALTPTSMSMLADRFPASRLGFAAGVYYMGVPIGVGVSLLIAGYLGPAIGWRNCFYALGALGVVLAALMLLVKETRPPRPAPSPAADGPADAPSPDGILRTLLSALRASPSLTLTIAGGVMLHFLLGAAAFDQLWLVQERGFERAEIARTAGWIGMAAGLLGSLFGGLGGDWWQRRMGSGRPTFLFWVMLILAPANVAYRLVPADHPFFFVGLFIGFFGVSAFYGPTFSTVQELSPPRIRATVVAFYILTLNLIGVGIGITVGGIVIDLLQARGVAEPYTWTLVGFTLFSVLAVPFFWIAGRRFAEDKARLDAEVAD